MIHRRTCALSYQIKGPPTVNWLFSWSLFSKPILASFTVMGPLIWYDSAQVRLWIILNIHNNNFYHLGKSQMCAGADHYFRSSKPHSRKLCNVSKLSWTEMVKATGCLPKCTYKQFSFEKVSTFNLPNGWNIMTCRVPPRLLNFLVMKYSGRLYPLPPSSCLPSNPGWRLRRRCWHLIQMTSSMV